MRRKRVTGRFYVFLILLLIGGFFVLRELLPDAAQETLVRSGSTTFQRVVDAVIVRDEQVASFEGNSRIVYLAAEGARVREGDEVCEVYSVAYSQSEITKLENVRKSIRSYHETILANILEPDLERLEARVEDSALQLKTLIARKSGGSLLNLQKQLESAMAARQDYLRNNRREDPRLNELYNEEGRRTNAIASWKTVKTAERAGVVSFYLDGFEQKFSFENLPNLTADDVRAAVAGRKPIVPAAQSRLTQLFRVVSTEKWYVIMLSDQTNWNLDTGREISFTMEGFDDVAFTGTVTQMKKTESEIVAEIEVQGDMGPLINRRSGRATIGVFMSSMAVPMNAVTTQGGQTGVWLSDVPGGSFIPVEVLSTDGKTALVEPLAKGALEIGWRILIK